MPRRPLNVAANQNKLQRKTKMPHDINGTELKIGDKVIIECIVTNVMTGLDFCNVQLDTVNSMPPNNTTSSITLNTKQVKRIEEV